MIINIDDSISNSDWIKWRRLDVPGIETFEQLAALIGIPDRGAERLEALKDMKDKYMWYGSLPLSIKERVDLEIRKLSKGSKRNA